jgi:hypothetical protein
MVYVLVGFSAPERVSTWKHSDQPIGQLTYKRSLAAPGWLLKWLGIHLPDHSISPTALIPLGWSIFASLQLSLTPGQDAPEMEATPEISGRH